jgi:integrase
MVHKVTDKRKEAKMITLRQAIEAYITTLKSEGMSKSYTSWLERRLRDFYLSVQGTGQNDVALGEVTLEDARRFIGFLLQKNTKYDHHHLIVQQMEGLSPTTIHGYARCIRSFGTFLLREGYTPDDIFAALKPPKVPKKIIEPLTEEEIRRILTVIPRETSVHDSGEARTTGHITKHGRRDIRRAIVQAANIAVQDHPFWKKELARLEPRLGRSRAIVRIARLLLVAVWHILKSEVADKHADARSVAASLFAHAYRVKVRNLGGLSAKEWTRRELERLGIGRELHVIPWGTKKVKLPPSTLPPEKR